MKVTRTILTAAALGGLLAPAALAQAAKPAQTAKPAAAAGDLPISIERDNRFLLLSDAGLARAFPNAATRPDAVFMTRDRQVSVSLEYRNTTLRPSEVSGLLTQYPAVLRKQLPGVQNVTADMVRIGGNQWAQFVVTLPGKNGPRRLEQLMTSIGNHPMVVTVDSSAAGYKTNETAVRNLVNSIRVAR